MTGYGSKDMLTMQNEAKQRVMEMHRKSKLAANTFNNANVSQKKNDEENLPRIPKATSFPTEIPQSGKGRVKLNGNSANTKTQPGQLFRNLLAGISDGDSEKLLIMSLCMLLSEESSDDSLIVALMYILT